MFLNAQIMIDAASIKDKFLKKAIIITGVLVLGLTFYNLTLQIKLNRHRLGELD